jgi:hypothetical protein
MRRFGVALAAENPSNIQPLQQQVLSLLCHSVRHSLRPGASRRSDALPRHGGVLNWRRRREYVEKPEFA